MKVDVNYYTVHEAVQKMKRNDELTKDERESIVKVIYAVMDDYIPTLQEMGRHERNIATINKLDPEKDKETFDRIYALCVGFDNKYC
jgi:Mg2+ and Co2+ transporter CorA